MFSVMPVLVGQTLGKTSGNWIMDNILCQEHLEECLVNYKSDNSYCRIISCAYYTKFLKPYCLLCLDMIGRRNLRTRNIKMFILDEADEMLNKGILESFMDGRLLVLPFFITINQFLTLCLGFKEQIYDVYRYLPPATQV